METVHWSLHILFCSIETNFFDGTNGARALIFPGLLLSDEIIERKNNDIHIIRVDKSDNDCGVS